MATSVYFSGAVQSEQNLYEDLVLESIKIFGQDIVYIPREQIYEDAILNETLNEILNQMFNSVKKMMKINLINFDNKLYIVNLK